MNKLESKLPILCLVLSEFNVLLEQLKNLAYLGGSLLGQKTKTERINIDPDIQNLSIRILLLNFTQFGELNGNAFSFGVLVVAGSAGGDEMVVAAIFVQYLA